MPSDFFHAKAGSTFTFDEYLTDSTNAIISGSRDTMTSTIIETNGYMGGKSVVFFVEEKHRGSIDTAYYAYETNGNLSVYVNPSDPSFLIWEIVPTGTEATIIRPSSYSFIGIDTSDTHDSTITSLVSAENITIKGQAVSAKKMLLRFRHVMALNRVKQLDLTIDNTLSYAPSLGYIVKNVSPSRRNPFGSGWINGKFQTLIDYNLK